MVRALVRPCGWSPVMSKGWKGTFMTVEISISIKKAHVNAHSCRFGCCSDGETPASGPDGEGCEENKLCDAGPFGCCPDKRTFAQGPHKQGCFECPEEVNYHNNWVQPMYMKLGNPICVSMVTFEWNCKIVSSWFFWPIDNESSLLHLLYHSFC